MANPLVLAGSGAAAGVLVGGPVGAAIGAGVGLLIGLASGEDKPKTTAPRGSSSGGGAGAGASGRSDGLPPTKGSEGLKTADGLPAADVESPSGTPPAIPRSEDEVIEEAANQNVDPATVTVGKDGLYQGEDERGVMRTLFADDAKDYAAAQVIQNRITYTETDCSDGSCVTGQTYESCRAYGFDDTHCTGLTSTLSYEYHRYGPDKEDEERASWYPLDAEIDKDGAWNRKQLLNQGDVWPCEFDYEGGFGAKCNGGIVECDTDSYCGDGRWCFHKPDGSGSECRNKNPVMNVCTHKNKWGEQVAYPTGMTHAEAMNQGICPFPGTYLTAAERKAKAAQDAERAKSQAGVVAVEATSTQQSGGGRMSMADILANSAAIAGRDVGSSDLINRLASQGASSVGSQIREAGLVSTASGPTPTAGAATTQSAAPTVAQLAKMIGTVQSAPASLRRKRGLGSVSPIAFYMGGVR